MITSKMLEFDSNGRIYTPIGVYSYKDNTLYKNKEVRCNNTTEEASKVFILQELEDIYLNLHDYLGIEFDYNNNILRYKDYQIDTKNKIILKGNSVIFEDEAGLLSTEQLMKIVKSYEYNNRN